MSGLCQSPHVSSLGLAVGPSSYGAVHLASPALRRLAPSPLQHGWATQGGNPGWLANRCHHVLHLRTEEPSVLHLLATPSGQT